MKIVNVAATRDNARKYEYVFRAGRCITILESLDPDKPTRAWLDDTEIPVEQAWTMLSQPAELILPTRSSDEES